jgi:hypothetical protein
MQFKSDTHKQTFEKTRDYLHTLFGEVNVKLVGESFVLQEGSTFVYVRSLPVGEKKSVVEVFSYVVVDVDVTDELMRFLLTYNLKLILGGFGLIVGDDGKGTILLSHTILGNALTREGLYASVSAIARVADQMDDQIVAAFGGSTALARLMSRETAPVEVWE